MSNENPTIVQFYIGRNPEVVHLASEDPIDLTAFPLGRIDATERMNLCLDTLKIKDKACTTDPLDQIGDETKSSIEHFLDLFYVANALPGKTPDYVTALKICYTIIEIDHEEQLSVLYQPLLLAKDKDNTDGTRSYNQVAGPYYIFDETRGFVPAAGSYSADQDRYKANIRIKHFKNQDTFATLISGTDAESAIFSFQEIFSLIYDNRTFTDIIHIYGAIVDVKNNTKTEVRHSLVISPYTLGEIGFNGMCADLAHLCPPHCKISYLLERF